MTAEKTSTEFCPASRDEWRAWLEKNHARFDEVWLVFWKKHTGKPTVSYRESLEEALCFGWIDGMKKRVDDERYTLRYTPRKQRSNWTAGNIKLARDLIAEGLMAPSGLRAFERRN